MKNYYRSFLLALLCCLLMFSCKKDETKAVAGAGVAAILKGSETSVVLNKEKLDKPVMVFDITEADFGYQAAVTNILQFAAKGTDFEKGLVKDVTLPASTRSITYTGMQMNTILLALNLPAGTLSDIDVRVKSYVSEKIPAVYSPVYSFKAQALPLTSWIYVPGAYQDWNPETADSLVSLTGNGIYTGVISFPQDRLFFKLAPKKSWDGAYGIDASKKLSPSGDNIEAPAAGSYELTADINAKAIEFKPLVWGLIGSATPGGWDVDTDMKLVNDGKGNWKAKVTLNDGELKFRKNHDWGVNLGGNGGKLSAGGDNIQVKAGNYTITLNPEDLTYSIIKI